MQNTRVIAFIVSELLRENQQDSKNTPTLRLELKATNTEFHQHFYRVLFKNLPWANIVDQKKVISKIHFLQLHSKKGATKYVYEISMYRILCIYPSTTMQNHCSPEV